MLGGLGKCRETVCEFHDDPERGRRPCRAGLAEMLQPWIGVCGDLCSRENRGTVNAIHSRQIFHGSSIDMRSELRRSLSEIEFGSRRINDLQRWHGP